MTVTMAAVPVRPVVAWDLIEPGGDTPPRRRDRCLKEPRQQREHGEASGAPWHPAEAGYPGRRKAA
jgi:hypothetical protein